MDRNSIIGLSLIAVIFIVYIYWLAPKSPPPSEIPQQEQTIAEPDTIRREPLPGEQQPIVEQVKITTVENDDVAFTFSNHGTVNSVELKKFKTYYQKPLMLAEPDNNQFSLTASIDEKSTDLYGLLYEESTSNKADTTV